MEIKKERKDLFFGVHFDFHAMPGEVVGEVYEPRVVAKMLDAVKPDYVQCDTKGHAGISSYPTKVGTPAGRIEHDVLRMWRELTKERGIRLYAHHSGLYDMAVLEQHPDWGAVDKEGNVSTDFISVFCRLSYLTVSVDKVFHGGKLSESHRSSCMELLCGNAYLCTESEFSAVSKAC